MASRYAFKRLQCSLANDDGQPYFRLRCSGDLTSRNNASKLCYYFSRHFAIITSIREQVTEYDITPEQIFGRRRADSSSRRAPIAPKYRDPKTGATLSGRGKAPQWIANAKNRDRFLIEQ